jgi:DNA repair exonuclease SbcCD ATPase subunit
MAGYGYRGRYGSSNYDEEERGGFLKAVSARAWFLIIPLIGLVYANARQVGPQLKEAQTTITEEAKSFEKTRAQTLSQATPLRAHISALAALGDTFAVRFTKIDSLTEGITSFLQGDLDKMAGLEAEKDSLQQIHTGALDLAAAYAESIRTLQPSLDSLKALIVQRDAEAQDLWAQTAQQIDQTDRILNPDTYRKNNALVTGQGDYPLRDELPKR